MEANHPEMAKRWAKDTPSGARLPEHVRQKKAGKAKKSAGPPERAHVVSGNGAQVI